MKNNKTSPVILAAAVLAASLGTSSAAYVTNVVIAGFSSQFNTGRAPTNLVSDTGLYGDNHVHNAIGSMWLSIGGNVSTNFVTFDLGAVRPIEAMKVWNYNEIASGANQLIRRGVAAADILTSTDGVNFTTNFPNVAFTAAPGRQTNFGQVISFGGLSARYVRINVITNHFTLGTDNLVGLSKVRFIDTNVPPVLVAATRNFSSNQVTVFFSESVTPATATNLTRYAIQTSGTNSATILSATLPPGYNNRVVLKTSPLTNSSYSLVATNVAAVSDGKVIDDTTVTIEPELCLWFMADAGVTTNGAGQVTAWADQSPAAQTASQTTNAFMPLWVDAAISNKPAIRFTGTGTSTNFLTVPSSPVTRVRGGDFAYFTVMTIPTVGLQNGFLLSRALVNNPAPFDARLNTGAGNRPNFFRGGGFGATRTDSLIAPPVNTPFLVCYTTQGTNSSVYHDGAFQSSTFASDGVADFNTPWFLGARADFAVKTHGDVAEAIFIRGAITDAERIAITEQLGAKYGLTIVSLVFNQQPQSTTKLQGETATFIVNVTANSPSVTYQWQRNGTNIAGATNVFYTTPTLTLADNASTYRVAVTVNTSTQFSDSATLTVLPDTVAPTVVSAGRQIWNPAEITVVFSEAVAGASATNASNYVLNGGASVTGARFGDTSRLIVLSTSGLTNGGSYLLTVQNVQDLFANVITTVQVPVGAYPAPALWLKADAGINLSASNRVTQWNDQSGNGNHATPLFSFADFEPYLITNGFNGLPVVRFGYDDTNYVTNVLTCASSPSLALAGNMSIITVASFLDYAGFRGIAGRTSINLPDPFDWFMAAGTGIPRLQRGNGAQFSTLNGLAAPATNTPSVLAAVVSGGIITTNMTAYLNGQTNGSALQTVSASDNGSFWIGHRWTDQGTTLRGELAELLVFAEALSPGDLASLTFHLAGKYGLPAAQAPVLSIAAGGGTATLSWPTPLVPFVLESTASLAPASWSATTNAVTTTNGTNSVTINLNATTEFFRLRYP